MTLSRLSANVFALVSAIALAALCGATPSVALPISAPGPDIERPRAEPIPELQTRRAKTVGEEFRNSLVVGDLPKINAILSLLTTPGAGEPAAIPMAMQMASSGRWGEAARILKRTADRGDPNANALLAWALQASGKPDEALAAIEAARTAAGPGGGPIASAIAAVYYDHVGNKPLASQSYAEAGKGGPMLLTSAALQRVSFLLRQNDRKGALAAFDAQFGENTADRVVQWRADIKAGKSPLPPVTPARASAAYLVDIVNLLAYGQQMGFGSEAESAANAGFNGFASKATLLWSALALDPESVDIRLALAEQLDDVSENAAAIVVLGPKAAEPSVAVAIARQEVKLGKVQSAIARLEAIKEARRDTSWRGIYAFALGANGRYGDAEAAFSREIERNEKATAKRQSVYGLAASLLGRGAMRSAKGETALANADIRRAAELAQAEPILFGDVGSLLSRSPETRAEGIELLRQARERRPADPYLRATLANFLADDTETRGEAVSLLRGLLSEDEFSPERMNQLGYTLVDRKIDLDEGYRLLRDAYVRRPNSAQIADSFGKAHYQFGAFERARVLMEKAVELSSQAPEAEIFDNLGDTYWRLGRKADARAQWQKALDGDQSYKDRALLQEKLENGISTPAPSYRPIPVEADPEARSA